MSNNEAQNDNDAEFPLDETTTIEPQKASKPRHASTALALLALLLSVAALCAAGWIAYKTSAASAGNDRMASVTEALRTDVDRTATAVTALESRVAGSQPKDYSADIDAVASSVDDRLRTLASLPARISSLENSVAALAGVSEGARQTFLLAETEYYMQIANAQLQLANNPNLASLALKMADERVSQLADPSLTGVRRALSDELAALDAMEKPDIEGASLTLSSLAGVVESLPIASADERGDEPTDESDQSGFGKAWSSVKDAMSGMVKVTPPDQAKLALLSPDAEHFLRNNVALQLQSARLALLRGEQSLFQQSLDDTSNTLRSYFDTESAQVAGALQTIKEIREDIFTVAPPDISSSLRLLRQFRTLKEAAE